MKKELHGVPGEEILHSSMLATIGGIAARFVGINLVAVFPQKDRWEQTRLGNAVGGQAFCRLIQSTREGEKKCRMCHAFMSIAASRDGLAVRRCHAGLSTVVAPVSQLSETGLAVLSTCMFTAGNRATSWRDASRCGIKLGLSPKALRTAFDALPELNHDKLELAQALIMAAAAAIAEIKTRRGLEEKLAALELPPQPALQIQAVLMQELKSGFAVTQRQKVPHNRQPHQSKSPALIDVVANLVTHKPNLPYTVASISAAARITPNHFSASFHRWTGQSFLAFLNERRIDASKELLRDLSLSISEVAQRVGYDAANYFARRFKKTTGQSPRKWRNRH